MLEIIIPGEEYYNEKTERFEYSVETQLILEHSLASLYDWESKWKKTFISKTQKTNEELVDYVKCMTLNKSEVPDNAYKYLTTDNLNAIVAYMDDSMTATRIKETGPKSQRETTAELIYSYMCSLNIPFECQYWHLNRLLTLIRVCSIEQQPPKKMSQAQTMRQNTALNKARKARRK